MGSSSGHLWRVQVRIKHFLHGSKIIIITLILVRKMLYQSGNDAGRLAL